MFSYTESFNQDMSTWDVSRVNNIEGMFYKAESFNQDLSKWDVSHVTDMGWMFAHAYSFNQDLSRWDVSRVMDMYAMFKGASSFEQTLCGAAWVNSNAPKLEMFEDSPGSISKTVCGAPMLWQSVRSLPPFFIFLLTHLHR